MASFTSNVLHEPFDRRIVLVMNRFASDRSTLALAIKEGEAIRRIIESEKIFSSDQLRYGKLPHLKDVKYHWEQTRNDLHFLCNVGQIIPNPDFAEACLFWRLKTGRSLAELLEDILTTNLEFHDGGWFFKNSKSTENRGKIISVLGLPAFGKSRFSEQLQAIGDFRLIDPDTFRFYTMAKEILAVDAELFDNSENGKWQMTQHMYGPTMRNVLRVLFLSTALTLAENGHDIVANGFALVDEGHSDIIFWIENEDLPFNRFTEMSFPSLDSILRLQETSQDEDDFLRRIDSPDLREVIQIIYGKIQQRVDVSRGIRGDLNWDNPTKQLNLDLQVSGANPKMNLVDIALKAAGIHDTVRLLKKKKVPIKSLRSEGIPSSDRLAELLGVDTSSSRLPSITIPSETKLPAIPLHELAKPSELYEARLDAIQDCEGPVLGLPGLIQMEINKRESPMGPGRFRTISSIAQHKCVQFLNGIYSSAPENSVHRQVLSGLNSVDKGFLIHLTANVLSCGLTIEESAPDSEKRGTSSTLLNWRGRWEPELKRNIPSQLHSIFILPYLGMYMLGEDYDVYRFVADISHDLLEESFFHNEVDGLLQAGELYSKRSENRSRLLDAFNNAKKDGIPNKYGPYGAFCAAILGDTYTVEEDNEINLNIFPTISFNAEQEFQRALGGISLGQEHDSYSLRDGPVRDCLLSLQKKIAFARMNKSLKKLNSETIYLEMAGAISSSFRDKIENVLTLDRYQDPDFIDLDPLQARAKVISYTGRLLASHSMMMETYLALPENLQITLSVGARTFTPSLDWVINERVNPKLIKNGVKPISKEDIYRFYWDFYADYVEKLYPKLQGLAEARVDEAFKRRGW